MNDTLRLLITNALSGVGMALNWVSIFMKSKRKNGADRKKQNPLRSDWTPAGLLYSFFSTRSNCTP